MIVELREYWDHLERYRTVTFQLLDLVSEPDLSWRPVSAMMTLGQQFLHIAQGEDFMIHGLFRDEWSEERCRLPREVVGIPKLRSFFESIRMFTRASLEDVDTGWLSQIVGDPPATYGSRLWAMLEHEVHHKAQIAMYLRLMEKEPPYFAEPLKPGFRPDVVYREKLGGI